MPGKAVGSAAAELPWLCPTTESLIALAEAPQRVPELMALDPALALFLLRFAQPPHLSSGYSSATLTSSVLPDTAAAHLAYSTEGVLPQGEAGLDRVRAVADRAGSIAETLAEFCHPSYRFAVTTTAHLAPLGWFAVAAVDPARVSQLVANSELGSRAGPLQQDEWGMEHPALVRRLANRWRLPEWIASTLGALSLPFGVSKYLVADRELFALVQLAVLEAEKQTTVLGLSAGAERDELLRYLGLTERDLTNLPAPSPASPPMSRAGHDPNPHRVPLLGNLLRLAADSRRRNGASLVARLESQLDDLHAAVTRCGGEGSEFVQQAKLDSLAELAAGAAHEINNPLAVISGIAQGLLRTEPDASRGESLNAVIRQANRIAGIVRDLMQFARPPIPAPRTFSLRELLTGVLAELTPLATDHGTRLEVESPVEEVFVHADLAQLRHALVAVVRNGIQAAGREGWVRVRPQLLATEEDVEILVEDSGPGLDDHIAAHAFDPFFSGRSAGRGRGLGLCTAWKFARQNGGQLRHLTQSGGPTCFVLTARRAFASDRFSLHSA